jgi:uncharacterized protein (UPF0332 family)
MERLNSEEKIIYFKNLMTLRTDVDYGDFEFINKDDAANALKQAKLFLKQMETVRKKLIKEISSR